MRKLLFEILNADVFIPGSKERRLVLKNVNWKVRVGEHSVIMGANGSGKSSLLKLLHGDLWPCSGSISWFNERGERENSRIVAREMGALVSPAIQETYQRRPWRMTVSHFLPLERWKIESEKDPEIIHTLRELFAGENFDRLADKDMRHLSQGQLRLVLLAEALLKQPRILLLDEFADSLDTENRAKIYKILEKIRNRVTIIFTSHHPEKLPGWCEQRLYLHDGAQVEGLSIKESKKTWHISTPGGEPSSPLFVLENVSVYINREKILHNMNWIAETGESWQICGANGSGKSTFLRLLAGDEFAAADGKIRRWHPGRQSWLDNLPEIRKQIVLVSDQTQIDNEYPLTAQELLLSGFDNSTGIFREYTQREVQKVMALIRNFFPDEDARTLAETDIGRLSTGQLRRLYLARAMLLEPAALLLDEPLNGLDAESRTRYLAQLQKLASLEKGRPAIIMVSHEADEVPAFIKRKAVFKNGSLLVIR